MDRPRLLKSRAARDRISVAFAFTPAGTQGYEDLRRDAIAVDLGDALTVRVASLADVIRSKEAAGRDKDRLVLPVLRRLLAETNKRA